MSKELSPEAQKLIEAAHKWDDWYATQCQTCGPEAGLHDAVRDHRASLQRWRVDPNDVGRIIGPHGVFLAVELPGSTQMTYEQARNIALKDLLAAEVA